MQRIIMDFLLQQYLRVFMVIKNSSCLRKGADGVPFGFKTNRSMRDVTFAMHNRSGVIYTCFIDLQVANDHLPRLLLLDILQIWTRTMKLVDILHYLYAFTTTQLSGDNDIFQTGCRQGGQECPTLIYLA